MQVTLRVGRPRQWHLDLVAALEGVGARVATEVATSGSGTWGKDVDALFRREQRLHRVDRGGTAPVPPDALPRKDRTRAGIRIDLTDDPAPGSWRVTFDDRDGEAAAVRGLVSGRFPVVRVRDEAGQVLAEGRPGSELPGIVVAATRDVLAGSAGLVAAAVAGQRPRLPADEVEAVGPSVDRTPADRARRALADAAVRRAYRTLYRAPHWRVGWRFTDGPGVLETGVLSTDGWRDLPDDGHHFYADPFPFVRDGRTHLFVEDFDHRLGRGVISVVEFDESGPLGTPRPVLEHRVHLSYPVVLEDEGETWMVPETSAAGTVELYRAVDYPNRWERAAVLLRDVDANDATPFRHDGRWWMTATVRGRGSCSDALHLWYADRLTGPWHAHPANPVLIDISSARPAGRPEVHAGRLLRPVQDGRRGYGAALAVVEVLELDPTSYRQRVTARLEPGETWPGSRLHTLNRAGRLEVVDGSARSFRLRPRGRH